MKKIYLLSAALFAASSMMAQSTISELMGRERVPQQTNVTEYVGAVNTPPAPRPAERFPPPSSARST